MSHTVTTDKSTKASQNSHGANTLFTAKIWQASVSQNIPEHRNRTEQQEILEDVVKMKGRIISDWILKRSLWVTHSELSNTGSTVSTLCRQHQIILESKHQRFHLLRKVVNITWSFFHWEFCELVQDILRNKTENSLTSTCKTFTKNLCVYSIELKSSKLSQLLNYSRWNIHPEQLQQMINFIQLEAIF